MIDLHNSAQWRQDAGKETAATALSGLFLNLLYLEWPTSGAVRTIIKCCIVRKWLKIIYDYIINCVLTSPVVFGIIGPGSQPEIGISYLQVSHLSWFGSLVLY